MTHHLKNVNVPKIETPLVELLSKSETHGLYPIKKMIVEPNKLYADVWALPIQNEGTAKLRELALGNAPKCCYDGRAGLAPRLTGFARMIMYEMDGNDIDSLPTKVVRIYEG